MAHPTAVFSINPIRIVSFSSMARASHQPPTAPSNDVNNFINRRNLLGLVVAGTAVGVSGSGRAAGRRAPASAAPPEKKDPNVTGLQAKILASKRRKEAMKQEIEILRLKGNNINTPQP